MKAVSLFSSSGIGEIYLKEIGVEVICANEILEKRANIYSYLHPETKMIIGDIQKEEIFMEIEKLCTEDVKLLLATPPCQGMSIAGKNRNIDDMFKDERNYLIYNVIRLIKKKRFDFVLIENVPRFLKMIYPNPDKNSINDKCFVSLEELFRYHFGKEYDISIDILDAAYYGVAQHRKRAFLRLSLKPLSWENPKTENIITVKEAIGNLPTLESGETSKIKYHYARKHSEEHILWMKHTMTGKSAFDNSQYYPIKKNGEKIKGFRTSYKRIEWDRPSPTITIRSDAISSQNNVHPGRKNMDGTYSDARVLTLKELFLLNSLPSDFELPDDVSELQIRQIIGESIPARFLKKIIEVII